MRTQQTKFNRPSSIRSQINQSKFIRAQSNSRQQYLAKSQSALGRSRSQKHGFAFKHKESPDFGARQPGLNPSESGAGSPEDESRGGISGLHPHASGSRPFLG